MVGAMVRCRWSRCRRTEVSGSGWQSERLPSTRTSICALAGSGSRARNSSGLQVSHSPCASVVAREARGRPGRYASSQTWQLAVAGRVPQARGRWGGGLLLSPSHDSPAGQVRLVRCLLAALLRGILMWPRTANAEGGEEVARGASQDFLVLATELGGTGRVCHDTRPAVGGAAMAASPLGRADRHPLLPTVVAGERDREQQRPRACASTRQQAGKDVWTQPLAAGFPSRKTPRFLPAVTSPSARQLRTSSFAVWTCAACQRAQLDEERRGVLVVAPNPPVLAES